MQLISVNRAEPRPIDGVKALTGIFKLPQSEPRHVTEAGLEGDAICNQRHHGGPDQAVYCFSQEDYAWFAEAFGCDTAPGTFGENLTISGIASAPVAVGDRFAVGDLVLEATAPRIPCNTLNRRMAAADFAVRFRSARRPGWYCRVLEPGVVKAGQPVNHLRVSGERLTMAEMMDDYYRPQVDQATVDRYNALPVAARSRAHISARGPAPG